MEYQLLSVLHLLPSSSQFIYLMYWSDSHCCKVYWKLFGFPGNLYYWLSFCSNCWIMFSRYMAIISITKIMKDIARALGPVSWLLSINHLRLMEVLEDSWLITVSYFNNNGGFMWLAEVKFGRFAFDNLYNLLVMVIMLNIVSGIIIDNFGTLREEEKEFRHDIQNICFICGNDR